MQRHLRLDGNRILPWGLLLPSREELVAVRCGESGWAHGIRINHGDMSWLLALCSSYSVCIIMSNGKRPYMRLEHTLSKLGGETDCKIRSNKSTEVVPSAHHWHLTENGFDSSINRSDVQHVATTVR